MTRVEKPLADETALIAELSAVFPGCRARPLREWTDGPVGIAIALSGEAAFEPGEPIGPYISPGDDPAYDGWVHKGFSAWVAARGWYVEVYEPGLLWLLPRTVSCGGQRS
ncbi:MAG: hypothetical protein PGN26_14455 [Xylophilus ampelinus]